jgi:hypothetical protein
MHVFHCTPHSLQRKKTLTLAELLQSKTNPTTKCYCTQYHYTLEDCDKNPKWLLCKGQETQGWAAIVGLLCATWIVNNSAHYLIVK